MNLEMLMELDIYQALTDVGVNSEKARGAVNAIHREIEKETRLTMSEYVKRSDLYIEVNKLVTKSDLKATKSEIQTEMQAMRSELKAEIQEVRSEIQEVRSALKTEIQEVRIGVEQLKNTMIQWFIGSSISIVALVIATTKFFH